MLLEPADTVIIAISGGMDSVVLAHLLYNHKQPLVLAHCNFQLRGNESLRDEQFVRDLAEKWQLPLLVETYDTEAYAIKHKLSTQVAARQLRYDFFERLRSQLSAKGKRVWIATAHHANDAAETLLINLFRGTGIDGLKGIPVKNRFIIRPLLFAYREQIESYARENGLSWVEDSSNAKENYARNLIRHSVLPVVQKMYPQVIQNLLGTMEKMREAAAIYHQMIERRLKRMVVTDGNIQKVPALKLAKATERNTLIWEWIKNFGFTEGQVGEVVKLLDAENGSYMVSTGFRVLRNRGWLIISPLDELNKAPVMIADLPANEMFAENTRLKLGSPVLVVKEMVIPALPENEAWIDAGKVLFPLILRPWKAGDYFYPLGMAKKKKVARFLIDKKLSPDEKQHTWVLESDKRIIWVVGYRMDDRFKITGKTKEVVKMKVVNDEF
jgi:tRNA(Ile)-lysidine synthase